MESFIINKYNIDEINIGYELEFYFFLTPSESLLQDISQIPFVCEIKKEIGNNQYEVVSDVFKSFGKAINAILNIKNEIQKISQEYDNSVIFNAVYKETEPPSSLQVSLSFLKNGNVIPLNDTMFQEVIQNLLGNVMHSMYLLCETENCYQRISNHNFTTKYKNSPTHITWGTENRTVAIRIAKIPHSNFHRIEYRLPSPIANPQLISLAILSSMICKSEKIYPQTFIDSIESNAEILPHSHKNALQNFINGAVYQKIAEFYKKYGI